MQIVRGLESYRPEEVASAVALGAFDGIHLGHPALRGPAGGRARGGGAWAGGGGGRPRRGACRFHPHPMEVLQPDRAPLPITTLDERLELIGETGIDTPAGMGFTGAVAAAEAKVVLQKAP